MKITRQTYDAVMDWPFGQISNSRDIVRRELPEIAQKLDAAKNLGTWYQIITSDICDHTDKRIIAASAKSAQAQLDRMVSHA